MADIVSSQILENGPRNLVMMFTGVSDGTGELNVIKVDATSATYANTVQGQAVVPGIHLKIIECNYDVDGERVQLEWGATVPVPAIVMGGFGTFCYRKSGGLYSPVGLSGATGQILLTTINAAAGATYSIRLWMRKGVPQS